MRSGRLLAEDSPQNLLSTHNLNSLEDVFLKLCMKESSVQELPIAKSSPAAIDANSEPQEIHPSVLVHNSSDADDQQQPEISPEENEPTDPIVSFLLIQILDKNVIKTYTINNSRIR